MKFSSKITLTFFSIMVLVIISKANQAKEFSATSAKKYPNILSYEVDLQQTDLAFFYQDDQGENFGNAKNLKEYLAGKNKQLRFAMNGGMYNKDRTPQGLFIENGKQIGPIDRKEKGYGNFYLQPNGIFYITEDQKAKVVTTANYKNNEQVKYATQSGPMLVIDGAIHPVFQEGSKHLHIRNGVGVLPNGDLLFAMSKETINLFDFATFFKEKQCKNALYLDGFVSRTYLPSENWIQEDGGFGVMIGEVE